MCSWTIASDFRVGEKTRAFCFSGNLFRLRLAVRWPSGECPGIFELDGPSRQDRIEGKDRGVGGHDRGCDVGQQLQMYVDEIKTQPLLAQLGSCAGVCRDLLGGIGPRQEPGAALQAVFVQAGSALNEQADGGGVEPYFNVADDLHVGAKGC